MELTGNKILITGATSGIGLELTKKFLSLGNQVIGIGRKIEQLADLKQQYENLIVYKCDITNPVEYENLLIFIKQKHSDLNILINNAGIQYNYNWLTESELESKIEFEIKVNLTIPLQLIAVLLPVLENQKSAAIVNVSSGLGLVPKQQAPVYCGTKAGIHITTKSLRYQLQQTNIKVFEIIPSLVATPMTEGRGKGKITPEQLVREFIRDFENNRLESKIGKVKLLNIINRVMPKLAEKVMRNGL